MADEVGSAALQSGQKIIEVSAELIKLLAPLLEKMLKELYRNSVDSINQIGGSIAERLAKGTVTNGELLNEANKALTRKPLPQKQGNTKFLLRSWAREISRLSNSSTVTRA